MQPENQPQDQNPPEITSSQDSLWISAPTPTTPTAPVKQNNNKALVVLIGVGGLLLAGLIVGIIIVLLLPSGNDIKKITFNSDAFAPEACEYTDMWPQQRDGTRYYCKSERDTWPQFKAVYEGVCEAICADRMPKDASGSSKTYAKQQFNLDMSNDADYQYFIAMHLILSRAYTVDTVQTAHQAMSANAKELDAINVESAKRLEETFNRFLAHRDLEYSFDTTFNGEPFKYDGKYTGANAGVADYEPITESITDENGVTTERPISPQGPDTETSDLTTLESWAKAYQPSSPAADGTYKEAVKTFVTKFGMELDYEFDHIFDGCAAVPDDEIKYIEAAYCHGTPNKIFINNHFGGYDNNLKRSALVDVIKHEMSHHLIGVTCGTATPQITGDMYEGVTSSYAVLFLGADRGYLDSVAASFPKYQTSDTTDEIAQQIHGGRCSVF